MVPIRRILIANRGEIACRIIRTCRLLDITVVLIASEADTNSKAATLSDVVEVVKGPHPRESYLNIDLIVSLAKKHKADAIHPGYGFLSEDLRFWEVCEKDGLRLIGPGEKALQVMGGKLSARDAMEKACVPIVPGTSGAETFKPGTSVIEASGKNGSFENLMKAAKSLHFPILVKPAEGGGGKGMHLVNDISCLLPALETASREAQSYFGSARVYLEEYFPNVRHVEIQVFGDMQGNVITLGERECSIQRRYQKFVEESPCLALTPELRVNLEENAKKAAQAVNYIGAGTVEFILTPDKKFYFLEMNTRLQVEHPVTEARFGVDLVAWQIKVAEGFSLPLILKESCCFTAPIGHAMEARLCAEDPANDCLPSTGHLTLLQFPHHPWTRIDTGICQGDMVTEYFDPLLAKVISWGGTREEARNRLIGALEETVVHGIHTNRGLILDILSHPEFIKGNYSTHFIDEKELLKNYKNTHNKTGIFAVAAAIAKRISSSGDISSYPSVLHRAVLHRTNHNNEGKILEPWETIKGWF